MDHNKGIRDNYQTRTETFTMLDLWRGNLLGYLEKVKEIPPPPNWRAPGFTTE